jgi:hypothetical protein
MPELTTIPNATNRQSDRRRVPRVAFKATSVITEIGSSQVVVARATELSRFGCFVQTRKSYAQGTRIHIEMADGGNIFTASGIVAYLTRDGMSIVFSMVESEKYEILAHWLSPIARRSACSSFGTTAKVRDLGSRNEQVLVTRNLSADGCFVKTGVPLPKGSRVHVRIMYSGTEFTAVGRVTDNVSLEVTCPPFLVQS